MRKQTKGLKPQQPQLSWRLSTSLNHRLSLVSTVNGLQSGSQLHSLLWWSFSTLLTALRLSFAAPEQKPMDWISYCKLKCYKVHQGICLMFFIWTNVIVYSFLSTPKTERLSEGVQTNNSTIARQFTSLRWCWLFATGEIWNTNQDVPSKGSRYQPQCVHHT